MGPTHLCGTKESSGMIRDWGRASKEIHILLITLRKTKKRFKLTSSISAVDLRTRMRLKCEGNKCKAVILAQKIQQQYEIKARAHSEYVEGGCWPWNSLMTKTTIFRSKSFGTPSTKCTWLVIRLNRY